MSAHINSRSPALISALEQGLNVYFTGKTCKNGHLSTRYVNSRRCLECCNMWALDSYKKNDGAQKMRKWRSCLPADKKNEIDQKAVGRSKEWRSMNPGHRNALSTLYKKVVKQRTPAWANIAMIKEIYKNCPIGYHVDHIFPLRGDTMSGLHVAENLQYLPAKENLKKNKSIKGLPDVFCGRA